MTKIAITGATSMIGVALIKSAVKRGVEVLAFSRKGSSKIDRIPRSDLVQVVECDLNQMNSFDCSSLPEVNYFYHIGWTFTDHAGRNDPCKQELNIQYTLDAVNLAKRIGAKKFIGAGSQAEYGLSSIPLNGSVPCWPEIPYGVAKYAAGRLAKFKCEQNNIDFNWIRILSVYGTLDNDETLIKTFIKNCRNNTPINLGPCTQQWDYLFEDDAGEGFIDVGEKGRSGETYCLGSGTSQELKMYLEEIKSLVNPLYTGAQYGAVPYGAKTLQFLRADITELTADTGWKPTTSFEDGIRKILAD